MHKLTNPGFIDPRWFNQMRDGRQREAVVIDQQTILVNGVELRLSNPAEMALEASEKVYVVLTNNFYLETQDEQQERKRRAQERLARERVELQERDRARKVEADTFNTGLNVPVQWVPGMKDVLSGLTENSIGNGMNKATVYHVLLQADLEEGRLHRSSGDFLCSSSHDNGKQWSAQPECVWQDSNGEMYRPKVTCRSCLKIAERWKGGKQ